MNIQRGVSLVHDHKIMQHFRSLKGLIKGISGFRKKGHGPPGAASSAKEKEENIQKNNAIKKDENNIFFRMVEKLLLLMSE